MSEEYQIIYEKDGVKLQFYVEVDPNGLPNIFKSIQENREKQITSEIEWNNN